MKIKCLTTFLDGTDRFEKDDERTVDDERGARFIGNGWAKDATDKGPGDATASSAAGATTDLTINSTTVSTGDSNG